MEIEKIEIDVFSGRPNPSWKPPAKDVAALIEAVSTETSVSCGPSPDSLGYKGFVITIKGADGHTQQLRAYAGTLWFNKPEKCYRDIHQLESLLIQQAKSNGFAQLIADLHL